MISLNKGFVLYCEYQEFEDVDCNYTEIIGVYKTKKRAIRQLLKQVEDEKELEMVFNFKKLYETEENMFKKLGYVELDQENGYGKVRIVITEKEVKWFYMKIIINNKVYANADEYAQELVYLQKLMVEVGFGTIPLKELEDMWFEISSKRCASWLCMPKTKEDLLEYLSSVEV